MRQTTDARPHWVFSVVVEGRVSGPPALARAMVRKGRWPTEPLALTPDGEVRAARLITHRADDDPVQLGAKPPAGACDVRELCARHVRDAPARPWRGGGLLPSMRCLFRSAPALHSKSPIWGSVGSLCARQTRSTTQPERGCAHPLNRAGAESRTSDIPAAVCRSIHDLPAGRTACRLTAIAGPPGR